MSKVIMFVRYSQILRNAGTAFVAGATDFDTYVKRILDPGRLALREYMFEHVALASLRAQTLPLDSSWFRLYVLTTDWLPERNRRALEEMLAPHPWAVIASSTPDSSNGWTMDRMLRDALAGGEGGAIPYLTIRLDDDDAISADFIERLQRYNHGAFADHVVSFSDGYAGKFDAEHLRFTGFCHMRRPYIGLGLAHVGVYDQTENRVLSRYSNIFQCGSHHQVGESHATVIDPTSKAFLRTIFPGQDSEVQSLRFFEGQPRVPGEAVLESVPFGAPYLREIWSSEASDIEAWVPTDPAIVPLAINRVQLETRGKRSYLVSHGAGFERIARDQAASIPLAARRIRIRLELGLECKGRDPDAGASIFLMQYGSDGVRVANDNKGFPMSADGAELEATFEVDPRAQCFKVALRFGGVDGVCAIQSAKAFFAAVEEVDPQGRSRFH